MTYHCIATKEYLRRGEKPARDGEWGLVNNHPSINHSLGLTVTLDLSNRKMSQLSRDKKQTGHTGDGVDEEPP